MIFRRVAGVDSGIAFEMSVDGQWRPCSADAIPVPTSRTLPLQPPPALLPIEPLSFRDCMLFEAHAIAAARGYVKRFMPAAYAVGRSYERITGRTFPPFKPHALWYRQPIYYMGNHLSFVPSGTAVVAPSYSQAFDYELELGFVLAKPLYNAGVEEATAAIGAFVVLNDFSARDIQRLEMASGFGPQKSKHFLNSMSETAATADIVLPRLAERSAYVRINGSTIVETSLRGMHYSLGEVLAHVSREEKLFPGELFGTGTLPGGSGMENGHWLQPGDRLEMGIEGVGQIRHVIL